jgi:hypothetical protein
MLKYIKLDNKVYRWRDLLRMRREQARAEKKAQPTLFPLKVQRGGKQRGRLLKRIFLHAGARLRAARGL